MFKNYFTYIKRFLTLLVTYISCAFELKISIKRNQVQSIKGVWALINVTRRHEQHNYIVYGTVDDILNIHDGQCRVVRGFEFTVPAPYSTNDIEFTTDAIIPLLTSILYTHTHTHTHIHIHIYKLVRPSDIILSNASSSSSSSSSSSLNLMG